MSIYVMSDIHGKYNAFIKMLENINFSEKDTLYVLGDIFDRGSGSFKILNKIRKSKNIILLKGNHELMIQEYLNTLKFNNTYSIRSRRQDIMDNDFTGTTIEHLDKMNEKEKLDLLNYLLHLDVSLEINVNKNKFMLMHSAPKWGMLTEEHAVWYSPDSVKVDWSQVMNREDIDYFIAGHTIVARFFVEHKDDKIYKIIKHKKNIFLDCGSALLGYKYECATGGKELLLSLACLRLDDFKEFYISERDEYIETKEECV